MFSFILLAGGKGTRMKNSTPKQFLLLAGRPIVVHILEKLEKISSIGEILIVCDRQYVPLINNYIDSYQLKKKILVVDPGATRQGSVYNALVAASCDNIIIHEASRPFVKLHEYIALITMKEKNVTYGYAIPYTVSTYVDGYITGLLKRSELVNIQLPQKFSRETLLNAHKQAKIENLLFTDDTGLLFHYTSTKIRVIQGTTYNLKITEPFDLLLGEIIYKEYILGGDEE